MPCCGAPVKVGNGRARSYIVLDRKSGDPVEVGVALDEASLEGLPDTAPHFDFHFYRIPLAERDAIDPTASEYAARAANLPPANQLPAGYVSSHLLMNLSPAQAAVPKMGLH